MKIVANNNADLSALNNANFEIVPSITEKGQFVISHATYTQLVDSENNDAHFNIGVNVIVKHPTTGALQSVQARYCGLQQVIIDLLKAYGLVNGVQSIKAGQRFYFAPQNAILNVKSTPICVQVTTASGNSYEKITENLNCDTVTCDAAITLPSSVNNTTVVNTPPPPPR